jgi:hypothetical protein
MLTPEKQLAEYIDNLAPDRAREMRAARKKMRALLPGATEIIYDYGFSLVIAYGPNDKAWLAIFAFIGPGRSSGSVPHARPETAGSDEAPTRKRKDRTRHSAANRQDHRRARCAHVDRCGAQARKDARGSWRHPPDHLQAQTRAAKHRREDKDEGKGKDKGKDESEEEGENQAQSLNYLRRTIFCVRVAPLAARRTK